MESLHQGLTFLAWVTGFIVIIVAGFLVKLLIDLSKLTKNLDETTTMVKNEIEPTIKEVNQALHSLNSVVQNTDKQVDNLKSALEGVFGASSIAFSKAKIISGSLAKGLLKGFTTMVKLFGKCK